MKKIITLILVLLSTTNIFAGNDMNAVLFKMLHSYGVNKCDSFIAKNIRPCENWHIVVSKHRDVIDNQVKEVGVVITCGRHNDTVKYDRSFIQARSACFLHERVKTTLPGLCEDVVDKNYWYVESENSGLDYVHYKNKGGVDLFAKEITMGNFKACICDYSKRIKGELDK